MDRFILCAFFIFAVITRDKFSEKLINLNKAVISIVILFPQIISGEYVVIIRIYVSQYKEHIQNNTCMFHDISNEIRYKKGSY